MDSSGDTTFWTSVGAGVAALLAGIWRFLSTRRMYNGPERRAEMKELRADLAALRQDVAVIQNQLEGMKDDIQTSRHAQERFDERLRRGDRETARELGAMSEAFQRLEYMIAHERGWTKHEGTRGGTPPSGYVVAPQDDQTPEPGR